jgi:hypothetical protein
VDVQLKSIVKENKDEFIPTVGWVNMAWERNILWPFRNSVIFYYIGIFVLLWIAAGLLIIGSDVSAWAIKSVFALFGVTVGSPQG